MGARHLLFLADHVRRPRSASNHAARPERQPDGPACPRLVRGRLLPPRHAPFPPRNPEGVASNEQRAMSNEEAAGSRQSVRSARTVASEPLIAHCSLLIASLARILPL